MALRSAWFIRHRSLGRGISAATPSHGNAIRPSYQYLNRQYCLWKPHKDCPSTQTEDQQIHKLFVLFVVWSKPAVIYMWNKCYKQLAR